MLHRLEIGTYAGAPGESVTFSTDVEGGGAVKVAVDGVEMGARRNFGLKSNPGDQTQLRIALFGAPGESCVVGIDNVDGGRDGDLLICQPHDPAPVHFYTLIVASAASMTMLHSVGGRR